MNEARMTKSENKLRGISVTIPNIHQLFVIRISSFFRHSCFGIRHC